MLPLSYQDIIKYNKQYHNLKVIFNNGYKTFSINFISDEEVCKLLIGRVNTII